jgi:TatA/E family protein of Tat protein translocase
MFNLGPGELAIILVLALLVFGPKKLPEIGKGVGQALREFKRASRDLMESFNEAMEDRPRPSTTDSYAPAGTEPTYPYQPPVATYPTDAPPATNGESAGHGSGHITHPTTDHTTHPAGSEPAAPVEAPPAAVPSATETGHQTATAPERTT